MAITINQQPQDYSTVYNEMIVSVESTNTAQTDFSYIFEVCTSGGTVLRTLRIPPEPNYAYGVSDVGRVLESYLGTDFFKTNGSGDTRDCDNSFYAYQIKIGEEYFSGGVLTQFLDLDNFSLTCINGSLKYYDFVNYDYTDYELDGITKQFLTDDFEKTVIFNQEGHTNFLNITTITHFRVQTYDATGSIEKDVRFANSATSDIGSFASAPTDLNNATLTTGVQPVIQATTAYYDIFAENAGTQVSALHRFNIKGNCGDGVVLHYLNDYGGFDSFPFITYKEKFDIKREKYKQNPNRLQSDGSYVFSTLDREQVQYHTKRSKRATLNTDFLSDNQFISLRQLVDSPEVYLEKDGVVYSVLLTANNYDVNQEDYDGFTTLTVEIEFSIEGYRQRY